MAGQPPLPLDCGPEWTAVRGEMKRYEQLAEQIAELIRSGVLAPGERVPSVRKMSSQLSVSHATVLQAYANLEDMGLIRALPQSGFYVHQTAGLTAPTPDIARVERPSMVTRSSIISQVLTESRQEGVFPLGAAVPHVDYLPVRSLHQQLAKVTRFQSPRAFSYMFSPGYEPLRRQVAIRMRDAGVVVDPSEVRERLARDPNSGYQSLDTSVELVPPVEPAGEEDPAATVAAGGGNGPTA